MQISPEISSTFTSLCAGAIVVFQGFIYAAVRKVNSVADRTLTLENTVFGPKGDNGMRGDLKEAKQDIEALQRSRLERRAGDL